MADVGIAIVGETTTIIVPESIRERLGLKDGDSVGFVDDDGRVIIERREDLTLEDIIGSFKLPGPASDDFDEEIEHAMEIAMREKYPWAFDGRE